jgi:hypothetical protein
MSEQIDKAWAEAGLEAPKLENNRFVTYGLQAGAKPEQFVLPDHDTLVDMAQTPEGQAALCEILEHFGVTEPFNNAVGRALYASTRLQALPPGSPEWDAMADKLIDQYVGSELVGAVRQVNQTYSSLVAIDGDPSVKMIWLSEDDDRTCDPCAERAGDIKTWAEWQAEGAPGPAVCEGGSRCRCDLIVID